MLTTSTGDISSLLSPGTPEEGGGSQPSSPRGCPLPALSGPPSPTSLATDAPGPGQFSLVALFRNVMSHLRLSPLSPRLGTRGDGRPLPLGQHPAVRHPPRLAQLLNRGRRWLGGSKRAAEGPRAKAVDRVRATEEDGKAGEGERRDTATNSQTTRLCSARPYLLSTADGPGRAPGHRI